MFDKMPFQGNKVMSHWGRFCLGHFVNLGHMLDRYKIRLADENFVKNFWMTMNETKWSERESNGKKFSKYNDR